MGLYLAGGAAPVSIFSASIIALLPFVHSQVAASAADGGQAALTVIALFNKALATTPISINGIAIITHLPCQVELPKAVAAEVLDGKAGPRGANPSRFNSAGSRATISTFSIPIITLLRLLHHPIHAHSLARVRA
jgi:hypothetical protein